MTGRYGFIGYHMPDRPAQEYADRAIGILQDIRERCPAVLPTFLAADSVLTLSGVRVYDAYLELYPHISEDDCRAVAGLLERHGILVLPSNEVTGNPDRRSFELLHRDGLAKLAETYTLPSFAAWPVRMPGEWKQDAAYLLAWSYAIEHDLALMMDKDRLPKTWLDDWWSPFTIRFGMLLGYPATAIESIVYEEIERQDDGAERYMYSPIAHADAYYAAHPTYLYEKTLANDPQIMAHQDLWSGILEAVYASDWHKQLQSDTIFQEALAKVRRIEENEDSESGEV